MLGRILESTFKTPILRDMKRLALNSALLIALLMASCGGNTDKASGGKIISIRDQIGLTDSLQNGNSSLQESNEEALGLDKKPPLEQFKVMVAAAESKNNVLVNKFVNYDSLDFYGSFDNFDFALFEDEIPSDYLTNKRTYLMKNSYLLVPTFLKSEQIKATHKNDPNSIESVTILKNKSGEYRISTYLNGNHQFLVNVSQDYPSGNGGGSLIYRFHIGSDKLLSLVHVMMPGGTVSF